VIEFPAWTPAQLLAQAENDGSSVRTETVLDLNPSRYLRRVRMIGIIKGSLVCVGCFLVGSGSVLAQRSSVDSALPSQRMLGRAGLVRSWWGQATLNPSRDKVRYLTADEENVYVQSSGGVVTSFDSETGRKLWAVQLGRRDQHSFAVVANDDYALVATGLKLYAVNKFTGDLEWELDLPQHPSTSPEIDDDQVYIACLDGSVYAFDLRTIHQLYNENLLPQWSHHSLRWRFKAGKEIANPPISSGRVVNFVSQDGSLYSISTDERNLIFQFQTDRPASTALARSNGNLFMASADFNFYCVDMENGQVRWEFVTGLPVYKTPRVIGNSVYLVAERGGMFCLNTQTGRQRWWNPKATEFLASSAQLLYTSDRLGNVLIISRDDGASLASLPLRHFPVRVSNNRTDRMYIGTESGKIVCIREEEITFPLYHLNPESRPLMPEFASENEEPAEETTPEPDSTDAAKNDNANN